MNDRENVLPFHRQVDEDPTTVRFARWVEWANEHLVGLSLAEVRLAHEAFVAGYEARDQH